MAPRDHIGTELSLSRILLSRTMNLDTCQTDSSQAAPSD